MDVTKEESSYNSGLSRNSQYHQKHIEWETTEINAIQAKLEMPKMESSKLREMFNPTKFSQAIMQVASSLQIKSQGKQTTIGKNNQINDKTGFVGKPFLGKLRPSQLSPWVDGFLDTKLFWWYYKDTGNLKTNCVCLNSRLAKKAGGPMVSLPDWILHQIIWLTKYPFI